MKLGNQVYFAESSYKVGLLSIAFDSVAVPTQKLKVVYVVGSSLLARDDVVNLKYLEREVHAASRASSFLLAK